MLATIDRMFENEKIIRIYSYYSFYSWNTRQMHFKTKISQPTGYESKVSKRIAKITLLGFFQRKAFKF